MSDSNTETQINGGRLVGRRIILTGAAGNIGNRITRQLLAQGARLVMTGRNGEKLAEFISTLEAEGFQRDNMVAAVGDCANPEDCRKIAAAAQEHFGGVDVLVNNAGSAGPKRTLREIPFSIAEKKALDDAENMTEAAMNLLGGPWNMVRAVAPHMSVGGSIINVSTIFSRTKYYGRIPYVVPKSGLNALSKGLAQELGAGDKAIRVNTVYPGPIESERIDTVFAAMDSLQSLKPGSTSSEFRNLMLARRADDTGKLEYRYPKPDDVASTITWLSSDESAAFSGHGFEVTNGMQVPEQSSAELVSWPDDRLVDLHGHVVLILGGEDIDEAMMFAERNIGRGARVVMGFRSLPLVGIAGTRFQKLDPSIHIQHLDPLRPESVTRAFQFLADQYGRVDGVIVLPSAPNGEQAYSLTTADDDEVAAFVQSEVVAPVALASALVRNIANWDKQVSAPPVTFVTNPDDGHGNRLNEIKRAAVEALIRVWRDEEAKIADSGAWGWEGVPNQIVRFTNDEPDNLTFAADWTATLNNGARKMDAINLQVPTQIKRATAKSSMPLSIQRVLPGLHHGKTALITGGSMGIGMQLGRYLAMAGARVLLAARSQPKLDAARDELVAELRQIGYADPEERIHVLANVDVGDETALQRMYEHTIDLFGDLDFLINNAGISGAEEMVIDMTLDAWNVTMEANLISNYSLIRKFGPRMKARGTGFILNVSSYFGGEKYVAVPYPNRADYSVSKAGQRALAEIMSRHLGPEIQINAMAPGPVDGVRLRGQSDAPGLFSRRGRLILENIRLNRVHAALLTALEADPDTSVVKRLATNSVIELVNWPAAPDALRRLSVQVAEGRLGGHASDWLLNEALAVKLVARLITGGQLTEEDSKQFFDAFVTPPEPFFDDADIDREAQKIESGILDRLHLHNMPTDEQVSLSTVFSLADSSVSGETFHPSGGLKFDRSVTEGEVMLPPGAEALAALKGRHVVIIGDAMREEITSIAKGFIEFDVSRLTVLTPTEDAGNAVRHSLELPDGVELDTIAVGDLPEEGLDKVLREHGHFDVVVNTPFNRLPLNALAGDTPEDWERVLSRDDFAALVHDHLTHHFRVAKVAALVPNCQIVLVTPDTSRASTREEFALAMFIKTSMHAFTVTLGVEGERLPTVPAINQVQLTRRARAEEPSNEQELAEEMERLVYAVLQCSVPAPTPAESRYLSRIFRGNALTV